MSAHLTKWDPQTCRMLRSLSPGPPPVPRAFRPNIFLAVSDWIYGGTGRPDCSGLLQRRAAKRNSLDFGAPFIDEALRDRNTYTEFIRELDKRGMIYWERRQPARVGVFTVAKKGW